MFQLENKIWIFNPNICYNLVKRHSKWIYEDNWIFYNRKQRALAKRNKKVWLGRGTIHASAFKRKQFETKIWRNGTCSHACGWRHACFILHFCTKGFYKPDKDGAFACKAQALFIKKHGKIIDNSVNSRSKRTAVAGLRYYVL